MEAGLLTKTKNITFLQAKNVKMNIDTILK